MRRIARIAFALALGVALPCSAALADVQTGGDISGLVQSEEGTPIPGATVVLTGVNLIQKEVTATSNERGAFRFPNIKPGEYELTITKEGFGSQKLAVTVNVGRTSNAPVVLQVGRTTESVSVEGEAPIIDKTSAQIATSYSAERLKELPNNRNFLEVVDTAPGITNRAAYGAGGNTEGYDRFGLGAATNNYEVNGVNVNNLQFGNSWVKPNYDTIQEIQVVGPGASAEYSNYTGALVNVVTKAGTNAFHGGGTGYYSDHSLQADNSKGILDLKAQHAKYDYEADVYVGGPIIPEKLTFFLSGSYANNQVRPPDAPDEDLFYEKLKRGGFQARVDFLADTTNTFTAMYNADPVKNTNVGAQAGTGAEVTRTYKQNTQVGFLSWVSTWGTTTISELRYAGVRGYLDRLPNSDAVNVYDARDGLNYNSTGFTRKQKPTRDQGVLNVTHYADHFLGASHEFKGGVEYERANSKQDLTSNHNVILYIIPFGGGQNYLGGIVGYNYHVKNTLKRPGAFVQDKVTLSSRATVSLGIRYDHPTTTDDNTGKTLLKFDDWAPRFGFTYDFAGNGHTVARVGAGRYYEKVPTYGPATYAGTGQGVVTYYGVVTTENLNPRDYQHLIDLVIQPANQTAVFDSLAIPVESGIKNPKSDVFNVGLEHQFSNRFSVAFNYINRHQNQFIVLTQFANPNTYAPVTYHSDFTGRDITYYTVTGGGPRQFALGNRAFNFQRNQLAILEARATPTDKLFLSGSVTYERSRGTRDNNECGVLSLCTNGVDTDPNFEKNPFYRDAVLSQERPWQIKFRGNYALPARINFGWDYRWLKGRPYGAIQYCYTTDLQCDPYGQTIYLEPRDARREPSASLLNLRLAKEFGLGAVTVTGVVDVLNVFNTQYDSNTNILNDINGTYGRESARRGTAVSSFGKPYSLTAGRQTRFGLRVEF